MCFIDDIWVAGFVSNSGDLSIGGFASGGAALTAGKSYIAAPERSKINPFVYGAFAGVGGGGLFTNAESVNQLKIPFAQYNISLGVTDKLSVSLAYDKDSGIW